MAVGMFVAYPEQSLLHIAVRIERGDADATGSTIRTALVVIMVIGLLGVITSAVAKLGGRVSDRIGTVLP